MARRLIPRLPVRCQHKEVALFFVSLQLVSHCHYYHDIFNLIKKSIEINNQLKNWWQSWQPLTQSKSRLMGFTLIKFYAVERPLN
jgi:hypothetical protein